MSTQMEWSLNALQKNVYESFSLAWKCYIQDTAPSQICLK